MRALSLPSMVLGSPPTARNIPEAGTSAWQRRLNRCITRRLVGGVFFLLALFASSAYAADGVLRIEWARSADPDVAFYLLERAGSTEWVEVARVRNSDDDPRFNPATRHFVFDAPVPSDPGRWRLIAVDENGNASPPVYMQPAPGTVEPPPSCTWDVAGYRVPVRCERACVCDVVTARLNEAREDLRTAGVLERPELLDQALSLTNIEIVGPERLTLPSGQHAAGAAREGWMLIASDMRSAAHELFHLYQIATGHPPDLAHQHDAWERDPRLRGIDTKHGIGGWHR